MQDKITSIDNKILLLRKQKKEVQQKKLEEDAKLIVSCGLDNVEREILAGALLFVAQVINEKKEEWRKAGEKFLTSKRIIRTKKIA